MEEQIQTPTTETIPQPRPWRFALTGCMVLIVFLVVAFAGFLMFAYKSPFYHGIAVCSIQMRNVGAGLDRYATKNDVYPAELDEITPDYIKKSELHCPADKSDRDDVSYVYHRITSDASDDAVVLECKHHKSRRLPGPTVLIYHKNGKVTVAMPKQGVEKGKALTKP